MKAVLRVEALKNSTPSVPLPPKPIITRWGMWLVLPYDTVKTIQPSMTSSVIHVKMMHLLSI